VSKLPYAALSSDVPDRCRRTYSSHTSNRDTFRLVPERFYSESHSATASTADWCYDGESFVQAERCSSEPVSVRTICSQPMIHAHRPQRLCLREAYGI
jgi:hypothetical protein